MSWFGQTGVKSMFILGVLIPASILFCFPSFLQTQMPWIVLSVLLSPLAVFVQVLLKLNETLELEYLTGSETRRLGAVIKAKQKRMFLLLLFSLVLLVMCVFLFMSVELAVRFSFAVGASIGFGVSFLMYLFISLNEVAAFKANIVKRDNKKKRRLEAINKLQRE